MLYLGIDQHAKQLTVSLRDEVGAVVQSRQVSTEPLRCLEFLTKLKELAGACGYGEHPVFWLGSIKKIIGFSREPFFRPICERRILPVAVLLAFD